MSEQIMVGPTTMAEYAGSKVISLVLIGLAGACVVALFGLPLPMASRNFANGSLDSMRLSLNWEWL
jgi:hypothetical protein